MGSDLDFILLVCVQDAAAFDIVSEAPSKRQHFLITKNFMTNPCVERIVRYSLYMGVPGTKPGALTSPSKLAFPGLPQGFLLPIPQEKQERVVWRSGQVI